LSRLREQDPSAFCTYLEGRDGSKNPPLDSHNGSLGSFVEATEAKNVGVAVLLVALLVKVGEREDGWRLLVGLRDASKRWVVLADPSRNPPLI
jgi:hypothetical protein